jgi:hypothetical protein
MQREAAFPNWPGAAKAALKASKQLRMRRESKHANWVQLYAHFELALIRKRCESRTFRFLAEEEGFEPPSAFRR